MTTGTNDIEKCFATCTEFGFKIERVGGPGQLFAALLGSPPCYRAHFNDESVVLDLPSAVCAAKGFLFGYGKAAGEKNQILQDHIRTLERFRDFLGGNP